MSEPTATLIDGLLLCSDLMWVSRITGTAQALSKKIIPVPNIDKLEALARQHQPRCIILDLGAPNLAVSDLVPRLRLVSPETCIMAFGSHVDVETLRLAREAGCDPVLPRSKMAADLPNLLAEWLG